MAVMKEASKTTKPPNLISHRYTVIKGLIYINCGNKFPARLYPAFKETILATHASSIQIMSGGVVQKLLTHNNIPDQNYFSYRADIPKQ